MKFFASKCRFGALLAGASSFARNSNAFARSAASVGRTARWSRAFASLASCATPRSDSTTLHCRSLAG